MSERPTPETDALASEHRGAVIWPDFARKLERERDDLKDQLATAMMSIRLQQRREQQTTVSDRRTPESDAEEDLAVNFRKDCVVVHVDCSRRLERERNEARGYVKELYIEMDGLFNRISFLQDALCKAREQYRLSSVCRELKAENEKLKQQQP